MRRILPWLLGLVVISAPAWTDAPARVGRLSFIDGAVSFSTGGDTWETATLNYPLAAGDRLSTAWSARAEAHIGSTAVRLAPDSAITIEALDDQAVQVRLDNGTVSVRVRQLDPDQRFEVDTQTTSISLVEPGSYRVDQRMDGNAAVTVREGDAEVSTGATTFHVTSRQTAEIPSADPSAVRISREASPDSWDQWVAMRDQREDDLVSARYVSREMDGVEDLDQYGSWQVIAGFGACWVPFVTVAGWAPYHYGHWAWVAPWGWTWIDNEPWGFAPFHYGRWITTGGRWAWVPGPISVHPVFRPALVAPPLRLVRRGPIVVANSRLAPFGPLMVRPPFERRPTFARPPFAGPTYARPTYDRPTYARPTYAGPAYVRRPPPRSSARDDQQDPEIWKWQGRR